MSIWQKMMATKKHQYLVVLSTCPDSITAKKIAQVLITDNLAGCVNIVPNIQSFFSWAGKVDNASEVLLVIKTTAVRYKAVERAILKLHPYELPEIIAVPIHTGLGGYLDWLGENTQKK